MNSKLHRLLSNPSPYISGQINRFLGRLAVIKFYRRFLLPYLVRRTRRKNRINVVFLAMNLDMWRYDGVYRRFASDSRFKPIIVTAMRRNMPNMRQQLAEQDCMLEFFSKKGYAVVPGLDAQTGKWIDLKTLKADIIFYTQPYNDVIAKSLEYYNHLNSLICYTPYSFQLSETAWGWDNNLQQYSWKLFYVNGVHMRACKRLSRIGAENAEEAGYCFEEEYAQSVNDAQMSNMAWCNDNRKRIIWAPHHSISKDALFKVSSFLEIADLMVSLREEYKERIVFAFKPHPMLKTMLSSLWGEEKANAYYRSWTEAENSFDAQGDYHALFAGSDAMIHCSGSFIVEYLYTGKPVAYVYSKTRNPPDIGPIGDAALEAHYPMHSETDIRRFLDNVVLSGHDPMREKRIRVAQKYLKSPNGKMFSENVYESVVKGLEL